MVIFRYFQFVPIAFLLACSATLLSFNLYPLIKSSISSEKYNDPSYRPLLSNESSNDEEDENDLEINHQKRSYGTIIKNGSYSSAESSDAAILEEEVRNPHSDVTITTINRSTSDRINAVVETLTVVCQVALSLLAVMTPEINGEWHGTSPFYVPYLLTVFWSYLFLLSLVRLKFMNSASGPPGKLWNHSTVLYLFSWLFAGVSLRSSIVHPFSDLSRKFFITGFVLSTLLVCLVFASKSGNRPARLYKTGDLTPSIEPVSSLFEMITFSWIQPVIWYAFWNPLEQSDVWDLRDTDHSFHILKKFRQLPKNSPLTIRLIKHFKKELIIAACWAIITSFTVFVPAMLVKAILDYVENPDSAPREVAWLYVFGIFAFSIFDNIANGQALFIGRRICIRIRSIIVGEVYAKSLRRKAIAGGESQLGRKDKDGPKEGDENADKDMEDKDKPKESEGQANLGAIINLMAIDAFKVSEICGYLHHFSGGIFMIVIAIILTYFILGWSAFVGAGGMLMMMPLNYKFSEKFAEYQDELMQITDQRVEKTDELLQSIRIIKYFAWEEKFAKGVLDIREKELHILWKRFVLWSLGAALWFGIPLIVTTLSFGCYTLVAGNTLTSPVAFTSLTLFNLMKVPMDQLADMLSNVLQSKVSIDRIEEYLAEAETGKFKQLANHSVRGPDSPYIGFENASFSWISSNSSHLKSSGENRKPNTFNFRLHNLNIDFAVGKMTVIIGPTGSGKTSLLMALLGEMELDEGRVYLPGLGSRDDVKPDPSTALCDTVAYCSQQAWLLNDTLKNNILFAADYNEERYNHVIEACALKRDLEILEHGDQTLVGEKGIALSGGQKQRISLARAMYSSARHILLDDCLSAVDSHTALYIYENCLSGPITANRTIILVSHNVALTIGQASHVVIMDNGRVKAQGTPADLAVSGALGDDELVRSNASKSTSQVATRVSSAVNLVEASKKKQSLGKELTKKLAKAAVTEGDNNSSKSSDNASDGSTLASPTEVKKSNGMPEETMARGSVDKKVFYTYIGAIKMKWLWFVMIFTFVSQQFSNVIQSWWIREWATFGMGTSNVEFVGGPLFSESANSIGSGYISTYWYSYFSDKSTGNFSSLSSEPERITRHGTVYYLCIYMLLGLLNATFATIKDMSIFQAGLSASRTLFDELLNSVLRSKVRFFDSTPVGRIMNRFSKDMEGIDQELSPVAAGFASCLLYSFTVAILITVVTPGFFFAAVVIFAIYWVIGMFYLATSRELKRLDSVSRSPIYQHFGETLVGVSTIRAYGDEQRFIRDNLNKVDNNNRPFFYMWVSNRWLSFRIDSAGALVSFGAAVFVLLSLGKIDSGMAGLSLSYALTFNEVVLWVVRLYAQLEMNLNSVERVQEYMKLESEAELIIPDSRPPPNWPSKGEIEFDNLCLRYAPDLPLVIKNVTFRVKPFSKIGIVGRTGAGKSTIITALFRFLEAEEGRIKIDGLDISTIGLRDLRQALAIIPQDPTLFIGSIRSNLDPFDQYTDQEIFEALRRVHLIGTITSASGSSSSSPVMEQAPSTEENVNQFKDLNAKVTEGGSNLSQGQRQLMCLARSLLKSPRVLLLDEATASIDYETDGKIQKTIREEFGETTLLTVAHRLRSIIDYDMILVMDAGQVVEYDEPHTLLQSDTIFKDMCVKSGEIDALRAMAEEAYKIKRR